MTDIKWIKITTDMFEHDKLDFIMSLPEADSIIVVWVRLLTLAGKCNAGGYVLLTENIAYTEEMLAHKFRKPPSVIKLALETLKRLHMIELEDGALKIANWEKHQNVEAMDKVREYERLRKQSQREKKKLELMPESSGTSPGNVPDMSMDSPGNVTVLDIDIELIPLPHSDECGEWFKTFWQAYPNKKGKSDAERKFKLYYRDKKMNFTELMEGLERYMAFCKALNRPFKDGSTFINGRAWEDDWTITRHDDSRNTTHALPLHTPERNEHLERALAERTSRNAARGTARDADSAS